MKIHVRCLVDTLEFHERVTYRCLDATSGKELATFIHSNGKFEILHSCVTLPDALQLIRDFMLAIGENQHEYIRDFEFEWLDWLPEDQLRLEREEREAA